MATSESNKHEKKTRKQLESSLKQLISEKTALITENSNLLKELNFFRSLDEDQSAVKELPEDLRKILAGFVHDLKNRITFLSTSIKLIQEGIVDNELPVYLSKLRASIQRMEYSVETMRHALKLGQVPKVPIEIDNIIKKAIDLTKLTSPADIKILYHPDIDQPLKILGNKNELMIVVIGIIENGLQSMRKEEQGTLNIQLRKLSEGYKQPMVELTIDDTGRGIPVENLERVFDVRFSTKRDGWGLGLYLAKGIVENMEGRIFVKSKEGVGTSVVIVLPINNT